MVMHARKLPRLNDGYYDRHQEYSYQTQNSRHNSSKNGHSSRYSERSSRCSSNERFDSSEDSPQRNRSYTNKSSYSQRYENDRDRYDKEKDSRYERDKDRYSRYDHDRERDIRYEREKDSKYDKYDKGREIKHEKERSYKYDKEKDVRYYGSKDKYYSEYSKSPKRLLNKDSKDYNYQNHNDRVFPERPRLLTSDTISPLSPTATSPIIIVPKSIIPPITAAAASSAITPTSITTHSTFSSSHSTTSSSSSSVVTSVNLSVPFSVQNSKIPASINSLGSTISNLTTNAPVTTRESAQKKNTNEHHPEAVLIKEERVENNRLTKFGDWSEHTSNTTGRRYYFNCRTKDCQWTKPLEWIEREHMLFSTPAVIKQENDKHSSQPSVGSKYVKSDRPISSNDAQSQDMEICSSSSTPTSEACNSTDDAQHMNCINVTSTTSPSLCCSSSSSVMGSFQTELPHVSSSSIIPSSHRLLPHVKNEHSSSASPSSSSVPSTPLSCSRRLSVTNLKHEPSESGMELGPPTPIHSEMHDATDNIEAGKSGRSPPTNNNNSGAVSCLSNITSLSPATTSVVPTSLNVQFTTSLSLYVRDDLTSHTRNWSAESSEKQTNKVKEDRCLLIYSHLAKLNSDLKTIRSRARMAEIMATADEQRFLMARENTKELDSNTRPPVSAVKMEVDA